jgi:enterochelin esterase-like enzyme
MCRFAGWIVWVGVLIMSHSVSASEIRHEAAASPSLGRDLPFLTYVPSGYEDGTARLPVLYLLHGAGDDENVWVDRASIQAKADRLIAAHVIPPMLIVMPGCPQSWWIDGARDRVETAFWNDLVPFVDRRYRTVRSRNGRFVAGLSSGGFGAIRYALKYPDRIGAAAALSPAIYAETPHPLSAARTQPPFRTAEGRFDQPSWTAHNYPALLPAYFAQPFRVPVYLVTGDGDRFGIAFETALLFKRLFEQQPDSVELRVVDGGHAWGVWVNALDGALRFMGRLLARPPLVAGALPDAQQSTKTQQ